MSSANKAGANSLAFYRVWVFQRTDRQGNQPVKPITGNLTVSQAMGFAQEACKTALPEQSYGIECLTTGRIIKIGKR